MMPSVWSGNRLYHIDHRTAGTQSYRRRELRSILWETMLVTRFVMTGATVLLPDREMMEYAEEHPEFDMRSITVFAEETTS